ncbi:hypothetical protein GGR57DRAFT_507955 [Xylariaceae sp. FL1272]|nr:hypothetical protein GGR57DRAFT_507955 [Xylariaceae sp. FL1272]
MRRAGLVTLVLAAAAQAAPINGPTKTVQERQLSIGSPTGPGLPDPSFILLPPITGGMNPSDKRETKAVEERQFTIGDPSTGVITPPVILPPITGPINPSDKKRQVLGGSEPDPTKAKIESLELQLETLWHTLPVAKQIKAIEAELLKYGITVVESPDGTTTIITPGKRDEIVPDQTLPGGPFIPDVPIPGGPIVPSN